MSPKEALIKLEEIDNISEFVEQIKLKHAFNQAEQSSWHLIHNQYNTNIVSIRVVFRILGGVVW